LRRFKGFWRNASCLGNMSLMQGQTDMSFCIGEMVHTHTHNSLPQYVAICLSLNSLSVCLFLSISLSVCLSVSLSVCLCLSVCLSVSLCLTHVLQCTQKWIVVCVHTADLCAVHIISYLVQRKLLSPQGIVVCLHRQQDRE
jgi:hypothetical protein